MNNYFVILAAGTSKRFRSDIPKQFIKYKGLMLFEHSIKKAKKTKLFDKIILVVNSNHKKYINRLSDFLFVLSRLETFQKGQKEIVWKYK